MRGNSFISRWNRELVAGVSSGLLLAFSFPPFPTRFLSLIALVPLLGYFIRLSRGKSDVAGLLKRGAAAGFITGAVFFLTLLFWVANLIPESSARMPWLMIPALMLLIGYLSCYTALFSFAQSLLVKRWGGMALFAAPALWSLTELARSRGELGFSWGIIASSLAPYPWTIQGMSVYGPFGLSFIMVFINLLIAVALFDTEKRRRIAALVAVVLVVAAQAVWGLGEVSRLDREFSARKDGVRVAVVQPNVDLGIKWNPAFRDRIFREIEMLATGFADDNVEMIVFPETAAPVSIRFAHEHRKWLGRIARDSGTDFLIGFVDHIRENHSWRSFNSAGLFDSKGALTSEYRKVNLLPFGERIPFSQYIPLLRKLNFGQANFKAGEHATQFDSRAGKFGVLICFESTFSRYSREYVRDGADFLVNITNDGWFGSSRGPYQHAETAIMRAAENRVFVLRAANTGVSMIIDPAGRVVSRIGLNRQGSLTGSVFPLETMTLYTRFGHLVFLVMALANLAVVLLVAERARRS